MKKQRIINILFKFWITVKNMNSKNSFLHCILKRESSKDDHEISELFLRGCLPFKLQLEAPICFLRVLNQIFTLKFPAYWLGKWMIRNVISSGKMFSTVKLLEKKTSRKCNIVIELLPTHTLLTYLQPTTLPTEVCYTAMIFLYSISRY